MILPSSADQQTTDLLYTHFIYANWLNSGHGKGAQDMGLKLLKLGIYPKQGNVRLKQVN